MNVFEALWNRRQNVRSGENWQVQLKTELGKMLFFDSGSGIGTKDYNIGSSLMIPSVVAEVIR